MQLSAKLLRGPLIIVSEGLALHRVFVILRNSFCVLCSVFNWHEEFKNDFLLVYFPSLSRIDAAMLQLTFGLRCDSAFLSLNVLAAAMMGFLSQKRLREEEANAVINTQQAPMSCGQQRGFPLPLDQIQDSFSFPCLFEHRRDFSSNCALWGQRSSLMVASISHLS